MAFNLEVIYQNYVLLLVTGFFQVKVIIPTDLISTLIEDGRISLKRKDTVHYRQVQYTWLYTWRICSRPDHLNIQWIMLFMRLSGLLNERVLRIQQKSLTLHLYRRQRSVKLVGLSIKKSRFPKMFWLNCVINILMMVTYWLLEIWQWFYYVLRVFSDLMK